MNLEDLRQLKPKPSSFLAKASLKCNSLSKTEKSLNIQLTPSQAVEFARHLLQKAQLLMDYDVADGTVQVWCAGIDSETISFGLMEASKGPRRKKAVKSVKPAVQ